MRLLFRNYIYLYLIVFFLLWCLRELWVVNYLNLLEPVSRASTSAILKIVIWVVPVFLLVKYVEKSNPGTYFGLRSNLKSFKWALWISVVLGAYFIVLNVLILKNNANLNLGFNVWLNHIILVGVTEEIVFRGFLLRKLIEKFSFWKANAYTSLIFVAIHFPIWFSTGLFGNLNIIGTMVLVFAISLIFGFIYKRTGSLWSVIIIHSVYDFFVSIFS